MDVPVPEGDPQGPKGTHFDPDGMFYKVTSDPVDGPVSQTAELAVEAWRALVPAGRPANQPGQLWRATPDQLATIRGNDFLHSNAQWFEGTVYYNQGTDIQ